MKHKPRHLLSLTIDDQLNTAIVKAIAQVQLSRSDVVRMILRTHFGIDNTAKILKVQG